MDFEKYVENIKINLQSLADLEQAKPINYGYQLQFRRDGEKATLCLYNGKKGLRLVWQGNGNLRKELELYAAAMESAQRSGKKQTTTVAAMSKQAEQQVSIVIAKDAAGNAVAEFSPEIWAGSDESGKGDFFGPLVISAVAVNGAAEYALRTAGVKDCKLLTDKKILELEAVIKEKALAYSVLQLKPQFYNKRYADVVAQGGKLNQLLASGHINALSKVLQELEEQGKNCSYALVDQFTTSNIVLRPLHQRFPKVDFTQRPKAESNLAVAAASILARAQFLHTMEELAALAGMPELPKGGGPQTTACAKTIAATLGQEALVNFVKMHFVNYKRI